MSKIYSRPRIRIPKIFLTNIGDKNFRKKQKMTKIFIIMVIAFSTVKIVLDAILPIFDTICKDKAKSIATIISNEQATNVMREHSYDELFTIDKDNNGNITMIKSNVYAINEIISDVAVKIQNEMEKKDMVTNEVVLVGFICKKPIYRQTPFGREIADILLAVNRAYNKSDYIPTIAWGRNARFCQNLEVGTKVKLVGRVQSRMYEKKHEDGTVENRVAYEVSVGSLEVIEENSDAEVKEDENQEAV